jgi:hypothetical protein
MASQSTGVQPIVVPQSLAYVLNNAGDKSGVDFNYLVNTAMRESSMNPDAKAPSSSAVGLFQFLDTTWLQVMKEEGPRLGYQQYADAITQNADGTYTIADKKLRTQVLALRENPQVAADMAAAFTASNGAYLQSKFGRMPSPGELYIAHFLGPQGAEKMFDAGLQDPDQVAAKLFPAAAKANPEIFYANGQPRTIRQVYKALVAQHDGIVAAPLPADPDPKFVTQQIAAGPAAKWTDQELPSRFTKADMSFTALFATQAPTGTPQPLIADTVQPSPLVIDTPPPGLAPAATSGLAAVTALQSPAATPAPLAAIDAATSPSGSIVPLPAPAPLSAPLALMDPPPDAGAPEAAAQPVQLLPPDDGPPATPGVPRARVLMTPGVTPNNAFFTQLVGNQ